MSWGSRSEFDYLPDPFSINDIDVNQSETLFPNPDSFDQHLYESRFINRPDMIELDNDSPQKEPKSQNKVNNNSNTSNAPYLNQHCQQLIKENKQLRDYVVVLQKKVEEASLKNQNLKDQLHEWRNGFSQAMFNGMHKN